jgi:hypothetical protein
MINAKFSESMRKCMFITDIENPSKHNHSKNRSSQQSRIDFFKPKIMRGHRESIDFINSSPVSTNNAML